MWLSYSLFSAGFLALRDLTVKRQAGVLDSLSLSFALSAQALPVPGLALAALKDGFWGTLAAALMDGLAALLYVRALQSADLSRAVPMLSFLPVFQILSAPFLVGELGLGGSVWGRDVELAERIAARLDCGTVWINSRAEVMPHEPFGGHKRSGLGVEFGVEGLLEYTAAQAVHLKR